MSQDFDPIVLACTAEQPKKALILVKEVPVARL